MYPVGPYKNLYRESVPSQVQPRSSLRFSFLLKRAHIPPSGICLPPTGYLVLSLGGGKAARGENQKHLVQT